MIGPAHEDRRGFTAARIIALVLIALVGLGLAYLRVSSGASPVAVSGLGVSLAWVRGDRPPTRKQLHSRRQ